LQFDFREVSSLASLQLERVPNGGDEAASGVCACWLLVQKKVKEE
jgi:hypothetical protein